MHHNKESYRLSVREAAVWGVFGVLVLVWVRVEEVGGVLGSDMGGGPPLEEVGVAVGG